MMARLTPFDLVFTQEIAGRFPSVADGLLRDEADPADRDAFLMNREAVTVIHGLVPEGGMGDAVAHLAALVHHAYLFWRAGGWTFTIDRATLDRLLRSPTPARHRRAATCRTPTTCRFRDNWFGADWTRTSPISRSTGVSSRRGRTRVCGRSGCSASILIAWDSR